MCFACGNQPGVHGGFWGRVTCTKTMFSSVQTPFGLFRWLWGAARAPWVAKSTDFTLLYFTLHNLVIFGNLTNFMASKKHRNPRGCLASPKQSDHKLTRQSHLPLVVLPALLALRDPGGLQPSCYGPTHVPQAERPTPIKLLRSLQHNNALISNAITTLAP